MVTEEVVMTFQDYWNSLGKRGSKTEFAKGVCKALNNGEDKSWRQTLTYMSYLARAGEKANPVLTTVVAIRDVSGGVVDLDSWL